MDWNQIPENVGTADFDNLLTVLHREVPNRATLFEFFLNDRLYQRLAPTPEGENVIAYASERQVMLAFHRMGTITPLS